MPFFVLDVKDLRQLKWICDHVQFKCYIAAYMLICTPADQTYEQINKPSIDCSFVWFVPLRPSKRAINQMLSVTSPCFNFFCSCLKKKSLLLSGCAMKFLHWSKNSLQHDQQQQKQQQLKIQLYFTFFFNFKEAATLSNNNLSNNKMNVGF